MAEEVAKKKWTYKKKEESNNYAKLPPQATELEDAVLGALMLEKDAYSAVCDTLSPDCFYKDSN